MDSPVISTKLGKVKGKVVELLNGVKVETFRSIPFAKPPTGSKRFMAPEPIEPWVGSLDGTKTGKETVCLKAFDGPMKKILPMPDDGGAPIVEGEDCLHLSIYTPANRTGKKLAVMVWLYGGGFQTGSEKIYDGSVLAGMNDVVVVVPNYRVGILGFFSLGPDSICSGNAGLLDQQEAFRWVQNNIEEFGGDRNNVTIFGESAGGSAVHLNILSPTANGLFHKGISHSGQHAIIGQYHTPEFTKKASNAVFKHLNIDTSNIKNALATLQKVPAEKLIELSMALLAEKIFFYPSVDGKVLPRSPGELLKQKEFPKIPYIIGCNNTEGDGLLSMLTPPEGSFVKGFTEEQVKGSLMMLNMTDAGYELAKKRYLRDEDGETKFSRFIGRLSGNAMFVSPAVASAIAHSDAGSDVYCYLGSFQLKMHHDDAFGDALHKPDWCECDHGDDILMTFGSPFSPVKLTLNAKFTEDEKQLSKEFMTYLTNFAKTGNPNEGNKVAIQWPKYADGRVHLVVNSPLSTTNHFGEEEMKFWTVQMAEHVE